MAQPDLKAFCDKHGILMLAYSPLGSQDSVTGRSFPAKGTGPFENPAAGAPLLQNATVGDVARHLGKKLAQVLIRWTGRWGTVCIAKSARAERIKENMDVFNWHLSDEDLASHCLLVRARFARVVKCRESSTCLCGRLHLASHCRKLEEPQRHARW